MTGQQRHIANFKKIKPPATHADTAKTMKRSIDNGLQRRTTRTIGYTTVLPKAGLDGFDGTSLHGSTFVLRFNFSANNPHLRQ